MALMGHSGSHRVQSMHSSGSMTRKFGPSWKQSTGQTSTQSVYLHLMQFSVTTNAMGLLQRDAVSGFCHIPRGSAPRRLLPGGDVETEAAAAAVLQVAFQGVAHAGEGDLPPGDVPLLGEHGLQAFGAGGVF